MAAKVLVVDDDDGVRESLCHILRSAGYRVVSTADGREALDLLAAERDFDALLLDLFMPRLDGTGVLDSMPEGPVAIVISAFSTVPVDEMKAHYGSKVCALLTKPVPPAVLLGTLSDCLSEGAVGG